jgi:hypothetical protein
MRHDVMGVPRQTTWIFLALKFAFSGAIIAVSLAYLVRIARPGGERRVSTVLVSLPFAAALAAVAVSLALHR